ncbi:ABC transporter substrate-binding protein [Bacillus sp. RG28]|uniref:ABC transporter substrate-binding protein n=1 Tax=Gottfriedia endophytica TaxID=2820819 RepID=A0A940NNW3_9BACI|nr:ABC transporter substrate-binding protein [Gottfriedia endophytica]MBP0724252.1 ABC transporter substrate-binding protein [Gottfriedia endophytica]
MKGSKKLLFSLISLLVVFVVACSSFHVGKASNGKKTTTTQQAAFPVTVTDATKSKFTIKKEPKRIVSLMPSNTEILFALNKGKDVVGVTDYDNYPTSVSKIAKVSGKNMTFNVEKIISLKPDLVLAHQSSLATAGDAFKQLKDARIPVYVVKDAETFDSVYGTILDIGKVTGKVKEANSVINKMKTNLKKVQDKVAKSKVHPSVYVEVSGPPQIYTPGNGTFINEMLNKIGAKNIASNQKGWIQYSEEAVIKANPDVIITTYGYYEKDLPKKIVARQNWGTIKAVQNKRVYDVNSDTTSRPGPRLVEGVEELAKAIYPELYK